MATTLDLILGNNPDGTQATQQPPVADTAGSQTPPQTTTTTPPQTTTTPVTTTTTPRSTTTTTTTTSSSSTETPTEAKPRLSYVEMFQQMNPYKPKSPEEIEKERKKQRTKAIFAAIGDGISALSNLYFTSQYAPNAYDPKNSLSAKMRERFDKAKKEQEANDRAYFEGYLRAMQADEAADRDTRNWRHTLEREQITDQRYADEQEYRRGRDAVGDQRYADEQQHRREREQVQDNQWQQQFAEGKRQFSASYAQQQQRTNRENASDIVSFALGSGNGTIDVPKHALTPSNISYIYSKLPQNVRDAASRAYGEPIVGRVPATDANGRQRRGVNEQQVIGYKPLTTDAMLIVIGQNIEGNTTVQNAIREIGGQQPASRRPNPMGGNSGSTGRQPNPMQ